jgi:hypothetical protein
MKKITLTDGLTPSSKEDSASLDVTLYHWGSASRYFEGNMTLQNIGNHSHSDTAPQEM